VEHLILEVLAYAADEAEAAGRAGRGIVTLARPTRLVVVRRSIRGRR